MVRARFKAGAKNVSASQRPTTPSHPAHHLLAGTPLSLPIHEIEVNRQSRIFPRLLLRVKTTAGSLRTIFI